MSDRCGVKNFDRSRRGGSLGLEKIGLLALILLIQPLSHARAQDWGKWVEPAIGSDKNDPPGVSYPGGGQTNLCEGMHLAGRHAYWQCMNRCNGQSGGYCWEGISDAIYTCNSGKGFRRLEKIRYTNIPCGPKDWKRTQYLAALYDETWAKDIPDPPELTNPSTPPTTTAELPPTTGESPPSWTGGDPPWAPPPTKEAEKPADGKTDTGKTDTAKTDTGTKDAGTDKTTTPSTGKKAAGTSTSDSGKDKKAPRKEVQKSSKTVARTKTGEPATGQGGGLSPEAATAVGVGVGLGLGFGLGGRGRMMDDRIR
jgi:hypothetical protein